MNTISHTLFHVGHVFSKPIHEGIYGCYQKAKEIQKAPSLLETIKKAASLALRTFSLLVAVMLFLLPSLFFSSLGALTLKLGGKNYIAKAFYPEKMSLNSNQKEWNLLTYNIGFLPGELAEKLTVGSFPMSQKERQNQIVSYLLEQLSKCDVILLQEVVDFEMIDQLQEKIQEQKIPCCLYYRIAEPLSPGISSGLCLLSKSPLKDFEVAPLPGSEPFFNRAFVTFRMPEEDTLVVTSHLRAGASDTPRKEQMDHIISKVAGKAGNLLFVGDFNFTDTFNLKECFLEKPYVLHGEGKYTIQEGYAEEGQNHPDLVLSTGDRFKNLATHIQTEVLLSDHYPIKITQHLERGERI